MKHETQILTSMLFVICIAVYASADFYPYDHYNMDDYYNIFNVPMINGTYANFTLVRGNLNASMINVTGDYIYLGTTDADHCLYFYEDANPSGESICWDNGFDMFVISDALNVAATATAAYIYGTGGVYSGADIYTTGTGDNLYLGTSTEGSASFWAGANGSLAIVDMIASGAVNITDGNLYMGSSAADQSIWFYEDSQPEGERLYWDDSQDYFELTDGLYMSTNQLICGDIQAQSTIESAADIFTTGSGDDLWLGGSTQSTADFQAYANGNINITGNITFNSGSTTVKQWLDGSTFYLMKVG